MSDLDFLHDMHNDGYSPEQIAVAAACGYNPWEWQPVDENEFPSSHPKPDPEGRRADKRSAIRQIQHSICHFAGIYVPVGIDSINIETAPYPIRRINSIFDQSVKT